MLVPPRACILVSSSGIFISCLRVHDVLIHPCCYLLFSCRYHGARVRGARVSHFLLEKARVVARDGGEASYHVFYYLLHGAPAWIRDGLSITDEKNYNYLHRGGHLRTQAEQPPLSQSALASRRSSKFEFAGAAKVSEVTSVEVRSSTN